MGRAVSKTPISDEELKRLYETLSTQKIGGLLGRNPEGIRKRLHKLGVKMRARGGVRTFTPSREDLEAEYQTYSMRQIADKYGVETQTAGRKTEIPPEISVISNIIEDGKAIGGLGDGEAFWHTDSSFVDVPPAASLFRPATKT